MWVDVVNRGLPSRAACLRQGFGRDAAAAFDKNRNTVGYGYTRAQARAGSPEIDPSTWDPFKCPSSKRSQRRRDHRQQFLRTAFVGLDLAGVLHHEGQQALAGQAGA